jgi:hypothetical protein
LVSISIGSNHGLQAGHTLEVFRLAPQPKYLGTIRLVNVTASQAVGRVTGNLRERIQAGDEVASRIIADGKASK